MSDFVYHFTDTTRLPWIIEAGELRPGLNRIGGYPVDFLWATTNGTGDRTSSSAGRAARRAYREGVLQVIRFTLPAREFAGWPETVAKFPAWTPEQVARLENAAANVGERGVENWRCRTNPLPLACACMVEAKSYASGRWTPIAATLEFCLTFDHNLLRRGFVIGEYAYGATKGTTPEGATFYGDLFRRGVHKLLEQRAA
jgi:hypothetical protein